MSDHFPVYRGELEDALPAWWKQATPGTALYDLVEVVGGIGDELAAALTTIFDDQFLATASDAAMRSEWGLLYGADNEDLALNAGNLRAYLQQLASEDGSTRALIAALTKLVDVPANNVGTVLTFDPGGAGLTFPADGSGLTMFEPTVPLTGLTFPADGSGLTFPGDGSGLTFPARGRVEVVETFAEYKLTVRVLEILVFDRPAFARAVARFRQAHVLPPTIVETP